MPVIDLEKNSYQEYDIDINSYHSMFHLIVIHNYTLCIHRTVVI